MPTIQQAQAKALGSGFLDTFGTGRADVRLNTLEAMLALYAEEFIKEANANLNKDNSVASGKLGDSIELRITEQSTATTMELLALDYYDFVNRGVRGVKGGKNGTSPYRFKTITPSRSHVESIRKWISENRSKVKVTDIKYGKTRQESKAIPYEKKVKQLAYIIARSIKKEGLKGTGFWDKAFDKVFADFAVQMSKALGVDIQVNLQQLVQGIKKPR